MKPCEAIAHYRRREKQKMMRHQPANRQNCAQGRRKDCENARSCYAFVSCIGVHSRSRSTFTYSTFSQSHSSLFAPTNRFRDLYPARGRGGRDDDSFFDRRMRSLVELELVTESSAEDTFLRRGSQKDRVDKPRRLFPTCLGFIRGFRRSIELF
jgi:hypothetical protein